MSDRTQSSVRTDSPAGDGAASTGAPAATPPASATQTIPATGSQRAQGPGTGSTPAAGQPAGAPQAGAAAAGSSAGAEADPGSGKGSRGRGPRSGGGRGPRRARLQLRHIDTWSALKISLVLSIALFFIWMVAVGILYGVLNALDVFDTLNDLFGQIGSASGDGGGGDVVTPGLVFGGAAIIGAINIVLMTALCTVGTFIYNLCSDLVGGLELTLSERD
ncbi:DUF3566 domain-containing protein [Blastococcus litoris]|uniref:DUF3566 domain-containing protein n=1 Tax=Blastococcus litoris TaxID=2171622 RepID=UPI000E304E7B|nr:DUF3566 domain-containing protein [Blastococcus litoris]